MHSDVQHAGGPAIQTASWMQAPLALMSTGRTPTAAPTAWSSIPESVLGEGLCTEASLRISCLPLPLSDFCLHICTLLFVL